MDRLLGMSCAWFALSALAVGGEPAGTAAVERPSAAAGDAARELFNTLILATVNRDQDAAHRAKVRLVLEHPEHVLGRYVITTFPQPQDYRKLLRDQFKQHRDELAAVHAATFCKAVRQGSAWFGPPLLADDAFALECALAAYAANDSQLLAGCRERLAASKKQEFRDIDQAAFDSSLSTVQKIERLHAVEQDAALPFKHYFLRCLSPAERQLPQILRVQVETLLEARKFAEALPLVEQLAAADQTPQLLFWQTWCLAALDRPAEAIEALEALEQAAPDDAWAACGRQLAPCLISLEENVAAAVGLILPALEKFCRDDTDAFEATVVYHADGGRTISVYAALLLRQGLVEAVIRENQRTVLAYKASAGEGRMFCEGEQRIQAFRQNAAYPVLTSNFDATADNWNWNWHVNTSNSADAMSAARQGIRVSSHLRTPEGLSVVLRSKLVGSGNFLTAVVRDADGSRCWLLQPQARQPELKRFEFAFAPDASLRAVDFGWLTCENLRYGPAAEIELSPPGWPDLPVTVQDELDGAALFRLMGAAFSLFQPRPAAVATAPAEVPPRR